MVDKRKQDLYTLNLLKRLEGIDFFFLATNASIIIGRVLFFQSCKFITDSSFKAAFLLDVIVQILHLFYFHLLKVAFSRKGLRGKVDEKSEKAAILKTLSRKSYLYCFIVLQMTKFKIT